MHSTRLIALGVLWAAGSAGGLLAQVRGLPVRNAGVGTGIGIAADAGFPSASAGSGLALGATAAVGLGPIGVTGSVARFDPKGAAGAINSLGATANLKVFGGPLIPISVTAQVGAAFSRVGSIEELRLPIGVGLALTIPNPVFSIKPWLAPRLDIVSTSGASLTGGRDAKFAVSGGVDLGFLNGLTIRAMYDRINWGAGGNPSVFSLGLGFKVGT